MPTLAEHLEPDTVAIDELHGTYGPMLHMVNELIGVIPDCDTYLEMWPPGFRTYNLCVPNFLNLPASLLRRDGLKASMGLAMYASSRAAGCPYCSAHTCSFALRRGASRAAVDGSTRSDVEQAVVALAEGMADEPGTWDPSLVTDLGRYLPATDIDWIAMSVGMMGFLNKFMDSISVPLEAEAINDVADLIEPTGWDVGKSGWRHGMSTRVTSTVPVDSVGLYARVFRHGPRALLIERGWTKHLPTSAPDLRRVLVQRHGVDVALLSRIRPQRPMRALAAMIDQNLEPATSVIGIGATSLAGLAYAVAVDDEELRGLSTSLARANGVDGSHLDAVLNGGVPDGDDRTVAVVRLAQAIAPSPAVVTDELAADVASTLESAAVIEVCVWVSVLQSMRRLGRYFA